MSKRTSIEMRASLRTDLKDSATVWSDTELDRCVDRAVSDLSRFLPRELVYEETIDYSITDESITTPADADPDYFVVSVTIYGESAGATFAIAHYTITNAGPVALVLTDDNFSVTAFTFIVKGTDTDGNYIEESFHLSGGKSQVGKKDFKTVVQVELDNVGGSTISAADTFVVGTTNPYDVWVQLAHKPIEPNSETVTTTDAATTYARDTDYRMDYANGRIKYMDDGDMEADTEYYVDYKKSRISLDLADIISDLITIQEVIYPVNTVPQTTTSVRKWGSVITLEGSGIDSQERVTDKEHMAVYYHAKHTPPSTVAGGSFPEFLEDTVILAASAYALFIEALQYEHQAVTDMASVRTILTTTISHTAITTALGKVTDYVNEAHTQIGKVSDYLIPIGTQDNAADVLSEIHDMETYLRDTIIKLADGTGVLKDANTELDRADTTDLSLATYGAEALILTGHAVINTVTTGDRAAENYREYSQTVIARAQARTNTALGLIREAEARMSLLRTYIEESAGWVAIADRFIADTQQRIAMAQAHIAEAAGLVANIDRLLMEAAQYQTTADSNLALSDRYRAEAIERRNEAWSVWRDSKSFIGDFSLSALRQPEYYGGGGRRVSETRL